MPAAKTERNKEIISRAILGEAFSDIAKDYHVTRERVRQIVRRSGMKVPANNSSKQAKKISKRNEVLARKEQMAEKKREVVRLVTEGYSIRRAAKLVGIAHGTAYALKLGYLTQHGYWRHRYH